MVTDLVATFLDDAAARAVDALAAHDRRPGRVVPIAPGIAPAWDGDCDGYLYGRIISILPVADKTTARSASVRCGVHFWSATLALAIIRCVAPVDSQGRPPSPARVDNDGRGFSLDAAIIQQSLLCSPFTRSIVQGAPLEESGGYSGFEWTYTVRVPVCDCPEV